MDLVLNPAKKRKAGKPPQLFYDGCMLDRNRHMVDRTGTLLAVYNGEYRGGTAATIRYARKLDQKIIIIDPATGKISQDA